MKKCKYFTLDELFAPEITAICSESLLWASLPDYVKDGLDDLREDLRHPIYINSKKFDFKYSGVRPKDCKIGAKYSAHKVRNNDFAFDLKTFDSQELLVLLELIKANHFAYNIKEIEDPGITVPRGWTHVCFSDEINGELEIFNV